MYKGCFICGFVIVVDVDVVVDDAGNGGFLSLLLLLLLLFMVCGKSNTSK
jgi:hypothetical protein